MIAANGRVFIERRLAGSRAATRVVVATAQGSAFDGAVGVVVDAPNAWTLIVELGPRTVVPFGPTEVRIVGEETR